MHPELMGNLPDNAINRVSTALYNFGNGLVREVDHIDRPQEEVVAFDLHCGSDFAARVGNRLRELQAECSFEFKITGITWANGIVRVRIMIPKELR